MAGILQPNKPLIGGVKTGSYVARGGNASRAPTVYGGPPSAQSGGANPKGSSFKPTLIKPLARVAAPVPASPGMIPKPPTYTGSKVKPVAPVVVRPSPAPAAAVTPWQQNENRRLSALAMARESGVGGLSNDASYDDIMRFANAHTADVAAGRAGQWGPIAAPPARGLPDPMADPDYKRAMAGAELTWGNSGNHITELKGELATYAPHYALESEKMQHENRLAAEQYNADLAERGALQSGATFVGADERNRAMSESMLALSEQYGPAAAARIQGQINREEASRGVYDPKSGKWSGQRGLDIQTALDAWISAHQNATPAEVAVASQQIAATGYAKPVPAAATGGGGGSMAVAPPKPVTASPGMTPVAPTIGAGLGSQIHAPDTAGLVLNKAGWHQDNNGKWNFRNAQGNWAYNVAAPKAGTARI